MLTNSEDGSGGIRVVTPTGGANATRYHLSDGGDITLGPVLAKAGEGTIYQVAGRVNMVAKIFHSSLTRLDVKLNKVAAMVAAQPRGAVQDDGFTVLTWPSRVLMGNHGPVGYVMSRIDTTNAVEIHALSNPAHRASPLPNAPQWTSHASWSHLLTVAANLCLAVDVVHRGDAVIGDFQERNILVADTCQVALVDCDSMQFTDRTGQVFVCAVGPPEFTAPELIGRDLSTHTRSKHSDLFSLAVHLHLLLMGGNHPFQRGDWVGGGEQPSAMELAKTGDWAGGRNSRLHTHPLAPPITFLPNTIQELFAQAFTRGATNPAARPSAAEWRAALLAVQVTDCPRGLHQIPVGGAGCPWCVIDAERERRKAKAPVERQTLHRVVTPARAPHAKAGPGSASDSSAVARKTIATSQPRTTAPKGPTAKAPAVSRSTKPVATGSPKPAPARRQVKNHRPAAKPSTAAPRKQPPVAASASTPARSTFVQVLRFCLLLILVTGLTAVGIAVGIWVAMDQTHEGAPSTTTQTTVSTERRAP